MTTERQTLIDISNEEAPEKPEMKSDHWSSFGCLILASYNGYLFSLFGLPWRLSWQRVSLQCRRPGFEPWVGNIPWNRKQSLEKGMATHSSILAWRIPWTVHSPWGRKESDMTERLALHFTSLFSDLLAEVLIIPRVEKNHDFFLRIC